MPPADEATPDFDSMSPEELMAWMETLAERQGASEGFTTEQRMDIAEVDPNSVQDTGPGYIPYGMSEDDWAKKQEKEAAQKAERQLQKSAPPPAPVQEEPAPAPPPAPEPVAASAPAADATPDFDNMSPEELMAWMETLAERQGASEGFTTEQRMDIAEVDPNSVPDTGPGYIPYGMSEDDWAKKQEKEAAQKAERQQQKAQSATPPPAPVQPEPVTETAFPDLDLPTLDLDTENTTDLSEPVETGGLDWLESLAADQVGQIPQMDLSGLGDDIAPLDLDALGAPETEDEVSDPVQWLDNLAGGEDDDVFELQTSDPSEQQPTPQFEASPFDNIAASASDTDDPMNWLESLAREQGVDPEEFTTQADMNVTDQIGDDAIDAPGYEPYAFESDTVSPSADLDDIDQLDVAVNQDDPIAWLDNLATSQSHPFDTSEPDSAPPPVTPAATAKTDFKDDPLVQESLGEGGLMDQLTKGSDVSSDDVRGWMDNLLAQGIERDDSQGFQIPEDEEDEDFEPEANIPDWLVEQVGPPPDLMANDEAESATPPSPVFDENIVQPQNEVDIPDWLQADADEGDSTNLDDIFAAATEDDGDKTITDEMAIQSNDPWVEAFELEGTQGLSEWYEDRLQQTQHNASEVIEKASQQAVTQQPAVNLQPAQFEDESGLSEGELQAVPSWLNDLASEQPEATATPVASGGSPFDLSSDDDDDAVVSEMPDWLMQMEDSTEVEAVTVDTVADSNMPDWLQEAGVDDNTEVPSWLNDTITTEEQIVMSPVPQQQQQAPPPTPQTLPVVAQVAQSPAPVPAPSAMDPAAAAQALQSARSKVEAGDVLDGLADYEAVIRANAQLDTVVNDLTAISKGAHKNNAAVHRILGDGLMRQGRLQDALNTYRKALNLL